MFFTRQTNRGQKWLPDGLNCLCYLAGSSKSHHDFNFLQLFAIPHQADVKNSVGLTFHGISTLKKHTRGTTANFSQARPNILPHFLTSCF
jgi:hypothetical protein